MILLLVAILVVAMMGNILTILAYFEQAKVIKEIIERVRNMDIPVPAFQCNVPPVDDKEKTFVQTAPPWGDTPAPPEEG